LIVSFLKGANMLPDGIEPGRYSLKKWTHLHGANIEEIVVMDDGTVYFIGQVTGMQQLRGPNEPSRPVVLPAPGPIMDNGKFWVPEEWPDQGFNPEREGTE